MFTTEGATCSASPEKSGRLTDGAGVAALPPLGFSAPPKMLIASLGGNRSRRALRTTPAAKPISATATIARRPVRGRSEEHTSELQSHSELVCRLLLEKKKKK